MVIHGNFESVQPWTCKQTIKWDARSTEPASKGVENERKTEFASHALKSFLDATGAFLSCLYAMTEYPESILPSQDRSHPPGLPHYVREKVKVYHVIQGKTNRLAVFYSFVDIKEHDDEAKFIGVSLAHCVWSILIANPHIICPEHDFSVHTLNFQESGKGLNDKQREVWQGHGLLSWIVEKNKMTRNAPSRASIDVLGRVAPSDGDSTCESLVEVFIELQPIRKWHKPGERVAFEKQPITQLLPPSYPYMPTCTCEAYVGPGAAVFNSASPSPIPFVSMVNRHSLPAHMNPTQRPIEHSYLHQEHSYPFQEYSYSRQRAISMPTGGAIRHSPLPQRAGPSSVPDKRRLSLTKRKSAMNENPKQRMSTLREDTSLPYGHASYSTMDTHINFSVCDDSFNISAPTNPSPLPNDQMDFRPVLSFHVPMTSYQATDLAAQQQDRLVSKGHPQSHVKQPDHHIQQRFEIQQENTGSPTQSQHMDIVSKLDSSESITLPRPPKTVSSGSTSAFPQVHNTYSLEGEASNINLMTVGPFTVHNLGTVVTDRPNYHTPEYIYPVNYTVQREFPSAVYTDTNAEYICRILDDGPRPKFEITAHDTKEVYASHTPTKVWQLVQRKVRLLRKQIKGPPPDGELLFGLKEEAIVKMIMDLPNAQVCRRFEPPSVNESLPAKE